MTVFLYVVSAVESEPANVAGAVVANGTVGELPGSVEIDAAAALG